MYLKQSCEREEVKLPPTLCEGIKVNGCTAERVLGVGTGRMWVISLRAAFPQGTLCLCPLRRTPGVSQSWCGHFAEIRLLPVQSSEPWYRSLFNTLSTPSRLQAFDATHLRSAPFWIWYTSWAGLLLAFRERVSVSFPGVEMSPFPCNKYRVSISQINQKMNKVWRPLLQPSSFSVCCLSFQRPPVKFTSAVPL